MQLAAVPLVLGAVGTERYGIVGVVLLLQALVQCLDLGLVATFSREMARLGAGADEGRGYGSLRAFEIIIVSISLLVAVSLILGGDWLAHEWMNGSPESEAEASQCVRLAGLPIIGFMLTALYSAGLQGLERQGILNTIRALQATVCHLGSAVLLLATRDLTHWVLMQGVASVIGALMMRTALVHGLYRAQNEGLVSALKRMWSEREFIRGVAVTGILSVLIGSLDRLVVSRLLSLEVFARYALAVQVGNGIRLLITPVFNVLYPRLVALHACSDQEGIYRLYRMSSAAMAAFIVPVGFGIATFPVEFVGIWTGNQGLAQAVAGPTSLIAMGTALNGLLTVPYALQLAHGDSRLPAVLTFFSLILSAVALAALAPWLGDVGAAMTWPLINVIALAMVPWATHRRLMPSGHGAFLKGLALPTIAASLVLLAFRWCWPEGWMTFIAIPISGMVAVLSSSDLRPMVLRIIRH